MGEPVRISEGDIRALLRIVNGDRDDDPADVLPWSLLADLSDQISSDLLSLVGLDSQRQTSWFGQGLVAPGKPVRIVRSPRRRRAGGVTEGIRTPGLQCHKLAL